VKLNKINKKRIFIKKSIEKMNIIL